MKRRPAEQTRHRAQDRESAIRFDARGIEVCPARRVAKLTDQLAPAAIAGNPERRRRARPAVTNRVGHELIDEKSEAAANGHRDDDVRRPVEIDIE